MYALCDACLEFPTSKSNDQNKFSTIYTCVYKFNARFTASKTRIPKHIRYEHRWFSETIPPTELNTNLISQWWHISSTRNRLDWKENKQKGHDFMLPLYPLSPVYKRTANPSIDVLIYEFCNKQQNSGGGQLANYSSAARSAPAAAKFDRLLSYPTQLLPRDASKTPTSDDLPSKSSHICFRFVVDKNKKQKNSKNSLTDIPTNTIRCRLHEDGERAERKRH